jgi:hypothetical protein
VCTTLTKDAIHISYDLKSLNRMTIINVRRAQQIAEPHENLGDVLLQKHVNGFRVSAVHTVGVGLRRNLRDGQAELDVTVTRQEVLSKANSKALFEHDRRQLAEPIGDFSVSKNSRDRVLTLGMYV